MIMFVVVFVVVQDQGDDGSGRHNLVLLQVTIQTASSNHIPYARV